MANELMQGLLSNLLMPQQQQRVDPAQVMAAINSPNPMASAMAYNLPGTQQVMGGMLKQVVGGRGGIGVGADEAMAQALTKADLTTSAGLQQAAQNALTTGNRPLALQLTLQAQETQKAEQVTKQQAALRENLITKATELGLGTQADMLAGGGDIADAAKVIGDEEKRRILATGSRQAKTTLARQVGVSPAEMVAIARGDYDDMKPNEFVGFLEGSKADLKPFIGSSGKAEIFKTSQFGRVYDEEAGQWRNPGEMGLAPAPVEQRTLQMMDSFGKSLWEGEASRFTERSSLADDAVKNLRLNEEAVGLLDAGIKSGAYANFRLGLSKSLKQMGLIAGATEAEEIANTETYVARAGERVANIIKAFGAGTGLSDADRAYAEKIAAGDIALDEGAMRKILAMESVASRNVIEDFNNTVDTYKEKGIGGDNINIFYKTAPLTATEINDAAQRNTPSSPSVAEGPDGSRIYLINDKWVRSDGSEVR